MKVRYLIPLALAACSTPRTVVTATQNAAPSGPTAEVRLAQFAPAQLDFDATSLAPWEKQVLRKLVEASDALHEVFLLQVSQNYSQYRRQAAALNDPATLAYFDLMTGPWDRLEHNQPFIDVGPKPPGAGYYPADMTKQEFEAFVAAHPGQKDALTGYFTVITRNTADPKQLVAVPYSQQYATQLNRAAALLREAAAISQNASLTDFLRKRADAFLSNDYYASDVAWMDISNSRVEPTIGPYEVYEDELFGYKAAFESFIAVADPAASAELDGLKSRMRELETKLPMEDRFKNPQRSFESPIRVVDLVYNAGDARSGVATIAYNLPNDSRVIAEKGSKKVMLRNVMHAKFDRILTPIGSTLLAPELAAQIEFQPWFINVLMHELAHGLGPQGVNKTLKERYSALEEAKADVTGLHNLIVLAEAGVYDIAFVRKAFAGHLADLFRATRFGTSEAHGRANLIQYNWFIEKGAVRYDASGRLVADMDALMRANRELATEILTIQANGDYDAAGRLIERYGTTVRPEMQAAIAKLSAVPVDVRPVHMLDKLK